MKLLGPVHDTILGSVCHYPLLAAVVALNPLSAPLVQVPLLQLPVGTIW